MTDPARVPPHFSSFAGAGEYVIIVAAFGGKEINRRGTMGLAFGGDGDNGMKRLDLLRHLLRVDLLMLLTSNTYSR